VRVKSVLIVDEHPSKALESRLERDGWICGHASDLEAASQVVQEVRPAVVLITESQLLDDRERLDRLQRAPSLAGVPLVAAEAEGTDPAVIVERLEAAIAMPSDAHS
jgi:DNA-binding response OmpR family regulator